MQRAGCQEVGSGDLVSKTACTSRTNRCSGGVDVRPSCVQRICSVCGANRHDGRDHSAVPGVVALSVSVWRARHVHAPVGGRDDSHSDFGRGIRNGRVRSARTASHRRVLRERVGSLAQPRNRRSRVRPTGTGRPLFVRTSFGRGTNGSRSGCSGGNAELSMARSPSGRWDVRRPLTRARRHSSRQWFSQCGDRVPT